MTMQEDLTEHEIAALRGLEKLLREKRERRERHGEDQTDVEAAFDADALEVAKSNKGWCPKLGTP